MKKKRLKKEMEYPDAPCGYVTMYNYKEPFMPFTDPVSREGYGYRGVLVFDGETDKVQCHFCGNWFQALGNHLGKEHGLTAKEYKDRTGLSPRTALIGESLREKLIANGKERFKNLRPLLKHSEETKQKIRETLKNRVREYQNITGTCPLQLIERLQKRAKELGRIPSNKEVTFEDTITRVFGSWNNAVQASGFEVMKPGQTRRTRKSMYTKEWLVNVVRSIWIKNHKFPAVKDWDRMFGTKGSGIYNRYHAMKKEVDKEVLFGENIDKTERRSRYSKDDLLMLVREFVRVHDRNPSKSDCKRGLLPNASRYYYHFGSFDKAVKLAKKS